MSGRPGRSGRRGKPAALRLVDGTHRRHRHGDADVARRELAADKSESCPSAPSWLGAAARAEWRRLAPTLHQRGLLSLRHRAAFAGYCRAYGELAEAQAAIERDGRVVTTIQGNVIPHPAVGMANRAADQLRAFLIEFGLSPSAETRVGKPIAQSADPADDFERERAARLNGAGREPVAK